MLVLKRLAIWSLERVVELCLLGGLVGWGLLLSSGEKQLTWQASLKSFWVFGLAVAFVLFIHGYYVTTGLFGVVWRSANSWLHSTITSALFAAHIHFAFMRASSDFTGEVRWIEFPFVLGGAGIVFVCSLCGSFALHRWTKDISDGNTYLSAFGIAVLVFVLANAANFLRPAAGDLAFRRYGLPFAFYREGGYIKEWVWRPGEFAWRGMAADAAIFAVVVLLLGRVLQIVRAR